MIQDIHIKNFKSIVDLSLSLGTFTVLIGENGSGKSNILEAIAFGAAASADKLDYEFLGSRGIRVADPEFMLPAFRNKKGTKGIGISYKMEGEGTLFKEYKFDLRNVKDNPKKWFNFPRERVNESVGNQLATLLFEKNEGESQSELKKIVDDENALQTFRNLAKEIKKVTKEQGVETESKEFFKYIFGRFLNDQFSNPTISNFIVYSPEQSSLRKFEETSQIYPLGIKGEGLFQYLKELATKKKNKKILTAIKNNLLLLDWYENFEFPENLVLNDFSLKIKDKYLDESIQYFDQRSTNEGFLYLLFYSTLFISNITPTFFAIDNIDASFNPKLCMQLTKSLVSSAKKYKKQVIVTTQNPAILDGLDLEDDSQRLFVVRRNDDGHTRANRIEFNEKRKLKLSELWTNGFIGGLPENF